MKNLMYLSLLSICLLFASCKKQSVTCCENSKCVEIKKGDYAIPGAYNLAIESYELDGYTCE